MKLLKLSERKRTPSPHEKRFEKMLFEEGFEILGIREYKDRAEYKITKDGIDLDFVTLFDSNRIKVKNVFEATLKCYEMTKKLKEHELNNK